MLRCAREIKRLTDSLICMGKLRAVPVKERCCSYKVNFHRENLLLLLVLTTIHSTDGAAAWIPRLTLLPEEEERQGAALCSFDRRRGQLLGFVRSILLGGAQMGFFLFEASVKASVVLPAI